MKIDRGMENMNDDGQLGTNLEVVVSRFVTFMRCPHRSPSLGCFCAVYENLKLVFS